MINNIFQETKYMFNGNC